METPTILSKSTSALTLLSQSRSLTIIKPLRSINDYKMDKMIGKGSYGEVYLARSPLGKTVAVKKICKSFKAFNREDTLSEIEAGTKVNHKNIVKYLEHFEDSEAIYIVMDYIEGTDLCTLYEARQLRPLSEIEVRKLFRQVIEAVTYIHLKVCIQDVYLQYLAAIKASVLSFGVVTTPNERKLALTAESVKKF
jgi:serine/threonine protein kinase